MSVVQNPSPQLDAMQHDAGFTNVSIDPQVDSESFIRDWDGDRDLSESLVSATIEGRKPRE